MGITGQIGGRSSELGQIELRGPLPPFSGQLAIAQLSRLAVGGPRGVRSFMSAGVTEVFANLASTTLNNSGTLTAGATSVTVTSGAVFPSTGNFRVIIESEIILVTARATNVLTLTRGQEGTAAAAHADGLAITHVLTKGALNAIQQARPIFTNTASATYTMDSTGNPFDVLILHNKSGAVSYVMPTPTAGRHIEVLDLTGAVNTLANNVFFVPNASEKFNTSSGFALSGTNYNFTNNNTTVTATSSKFQSELAVGMSIQSINQSGHNYIVSAIASDTSLTIASVFTGTTTTTATATRTSLTFAANGGRLFLDSDGTDWFVNGDGAPTILTYTASSGGTVAPFIPPQGVYAATITGFGGGGGGGGGILQGGGAGSTSGGAGGGGSLQGTVTTAVTPMSNNAVTIGAGGTGGTNNGGNGGVGGDSSVGTLATFGGASGGAGGTTAATTNSAGGLATKDGTGTVNAYGSVVAGAIAGTSANYTLSVASGGAAISASTGIRGMRNPVGNNNGGAGGSASVNMGGGAGGGAGPNGAGTPGTTASNAGVASGASNAAANSGAGGGGGGSSNTGTAGAGGNGGSGQITIEYVL